MFCASSRGSASPPSSRFSTEAPLQENVHVSHPDPDKASSILSYCTLDLIRYVHRKNIKSGRYCGTSAPLYIAHEAGIVADHVLPPACIYGIVLISTGSRPPSYLRSSHSNETEFHAEREIKSLRPNSSLFTLTPLTHIILPNSLLCSHHSSSKVSIRMQKTPHPSHNSWIWCMSVSLHIDRSSQAIYFSMRSYFSMRKYVTQK